MHDSFCLHGQTLSRMLSVININIMLGVEFHDAIVNHISKIGN